MRKPAAPRSKKRWAAGHGGGWKPRPHAASELLRGFWRRSGLEEDRVAILSAIWEREAGAFRSHWALDGIRKDTLYVRTRSPASAQELALRSRDLIRALNKHFRRPWIRAIRAKAGA